MTLMHLAKNTGTSVFVVGHVNKEGAIAGPKVLEHMVDCVLYIEGERSSNYRILRSAKNRFGSTNEIGVFEMEENGLREVPNPSEVMLSGRPVNAPGTCVACVMQGTRPVLAEIQALLTPTGLAQARRNTNGVDYNRTMLLLAVLEKIGGLHVSGCDAYINVVGGLELDEPSADLAIALAVASSFRDKPIGEDLCAVGEVGLTGELRSVQNINQRLQEIARLGFKRCVIPAHCKDDVKAPEGLRILPAKSIREAVNAVVILTAAERRSGPTKGLSTEKTCFTPAPN
jgi:DNA repair protein RadA/Sms